MVSVPQVSLWGRIFYISCDTYFLCHLTPYYGLAEKSDVEKVDTKIKFSVLKKNQIVFTNIMEIRCENERRRG